MCAPGSSGDEAEAAPANRRPQPASRRRTQAAEPLKNGATGMPGVAGPETMPAATCDPGDERRGAEPGHVAGRSRRRAPQAAP